VIQLSGVDWQSERKVLKDLMASLRASRLACSAGVRSWNFSMELPANELQMPFWMSVMIEAETNILLTSGKAGMEWKKKIWG